MIRLLLWLWTSNVFSEAFALPQNEQTLSLQELISTLESSQTMNQPDYLDSRSVEMDQTIASFTEQGLCFHYFAERPLSHPNPCIQYCKNNGGHGYSGVSTPLYIILSSLPWNHI
jgi:hypothetical protein